MDYNQIIAQLEKQTTNYLEIVNKETLSDKFKQFYFKGLFKQQPVLWQVNLFARNKNQADPLLQSYQLSLIETNIYQIDIFLAIDEIKRRDILMSMIMINQYKKLDLGEHKWHRK